MQSFIVFFGIAGAVCLLLFGLGLVRDGATEAFGVKLKMALGLGTRTGLRAFMSGLLVTLGLQSSTATALATASFVERDMIPARRAQIVLLGANVGTALTAWIVMSGFEALAPALLFAGFVLRRQARATLSGTGLALLGVGLMLVSLMLLDQATMPLRQSGTMAAFLAMLDNSWPVALLIGAALAALCSSSLAIVLLIASLSLSPALTVVMVLGANLGGAVSPVLTTMRSANSARRVMIGNLAIRTIGSLAALPFAGIAGVALTQSPWSQSHLAVEAHLGFNILLAMLIYPLAGIIAKVIERALPDSETLTAATPQWLDDSALETPALALAGASREALAIGDIIERMLVQTQTAFRTGDAAPLAEVAVLEDRVDRLQQEVKIYLSRLGQRAGEEDKRRSITILDYVINLEHIGDIIDKGLGPEVRKKVGTGLRFSDEGYDELNRMFLITLDNLKVAQTIFMTRDRGLARRLMEVKVEIRRMERHSAQRHLMRLRDGQAESLQTSSLHLDMLRDLKRLNAHIVSVAHPILDEEGLLFESRLKSLSPAIQGREP